MLRLLKKLWNWLKSLCGWTGLPQKQRLNTAVTTPKPEPSEADYETMARDLQQFGLVAVRDLGEVARQISRQLARIFSTDLMLKEIVIWQFLSPLAQK